MSRMEEIIDSINSSAVFCLGFDLFLFILNRNNLDRSISVLVRVFPAGTSANELRANEPLQAGKTHYTF